VVGFEIPDSELPEVETASKLRRFREEGADVGDDELLSLRFLLKISWRKSTGGSYVPRNPLSRKECLITITVECLPVILKLSGQKDYLKHTYA
jgi:hypothetical protein